MLAPAPALQHQHVYGVPHSLFSRHECARGSARACGAATWARAWGARGRCRGQRCPLARPCCPCGGPSRSQRSRRRSGPRRQRSPTRTLAGTPIADPSVRA
eukprot:scaffold43587_cov36-Phaeocystis_antarctica.AAC.2